jgi:glycosyltransferase involved in cell wall biosynthesis
MKIAFVIQRYGEFIVGGSEYHCRLLVEHLAKYFEIEVLTTCAKEYITWKNEFSSGVEYINGIKVRRFLNDFERGDEFHKLYLKILGGIRPDRFNTNYKIVVSSIKKASEKDQLECIKLQGPYSSNLFDYLESHGADYDIFVFFTYLYPTTVFGITKVSPDKVILIPTAHDEPIIYFDIFQEIFNIPRAIIYNTEDEMRLINSMFNNRNIAYEIAGMGVDAPEITDPHDFRDKYKINGEFVLYIGRIDEAKGCKELIQYFLRYKEETGSDIKLVLIGMLAMEIPRHEDLVYIGFLPEKDKFDGIGASQLLIMPSLFESFSIVIMESWLCSKPVLVNGRCEVLRGHAIKSNGGIWYQDYDEFKDCLTLLLSSSKLRDKMGKNGKKYVNNAYTWPIIEEKCIRLIDKILRDKEPGQYL